MEGYLPIAILLLVTSLTCALLLWLASRLGPRVADEVKDTPYEGGDDPLGRARVRLTVPFFRVGILFLGFTAAAVFLFPWALTFRERLADGNAGLIAIVVFTAMLGFGYAYAVRKGAIDWE